MSDPESKETLRPGAAQWRVYAMKVLRMIAYTQGKQSQAIPIDHARGHNEFQAMEERCEE